MNNMLLLVALWLPADLGIGYFLDRLFFTKRSPSLIAFNAGELGLLGLIGLTTAGTILHFIMPLGPSVSMASLVLGWFGFLFWCKKNYTVISVGDFFAFVVILLATCLLPFQGHVPDTELYHLQTIRWNTDFVLPLGLANLTEELGFNTSWFVLLAMFCLPKFGIEGALTANAQIVIFGFMALWFSLRDSKLSRQESTASFGSRSFGFAHAVWIALGYQTLQALGSTSTDVPSYVLTAYVLYLALRIVEGTSTVASWRLVVLLTAFCLTVKVSALPLAGIFLIPVLSLSRPFFRPKEAMKLATSLGIPCGILLALLVLPWMIRGTALSGCVVYPASSTCLKSIPWEASKPARIVSEKIKHFSRYRNQSIPADGKWLSNWLQDGFWVSTRPNKVAFWCGIFALALMLSSFFRRRKTTSAEVGLLGILGFVLIGILFWWVTAPQPRYAMGFLYSLPFLILGLALSRLGWAGHFLRYYRKGLILLLSLLSLLLVRRLTVQRSFFQEVWSRWPEIPAISGKEVSYEGVTFRHNPDSPVSCWNLLPPCRGDFSDNLQVSFKNGRFTFRSAGK